MFQETVARQRAAGVLQSAWRHRPGSRILQEEQQRAKGTRPKTMVVKVEEDDPASLAASAMTPAVDAEQNPSTEPPHATSRQQLLTGADGYGAVYAVWAAFTSLLTATATRCAVRRSVEQALLSPAAAMLTTFNQQCRNSTITATLGSSPSPSSSSSALSAASKTRLAAVPPDPASFDCAPRLNRDMAVAVRRMAGTLLARTSLLSGVRAAARRLSDGGSGGSGRGFGSGSGVEVDGDRERARVATERVQDEAVALVSEVAEVRVFSCVGVRRPHRPGTKHFFLKEPPRTHQNVGTQHTAHGTTIRGRAGLAFGRWDDEFVPVVPIVPNQDE